MTFLSPTRTERILPEWPTTAGGAEAGQVGGARPRRSARRGRRAAGSQPEPMTSSTSCLSTPVSSASLAAASWASAFGSSVTALVTRYVRDRWTCRAWRVAPRRSRRARRPPRRPRRARRGTTPRAAHPRRRPARRPSTATSPVMVATRSRGLAVEPGVAPSQLSRTATSSSVTSYTATKTCSKWSWTIVARAPSQPRSSPPNVSRQPCSQPVPCSGECGQRSQHAARIHVGPVGGVQGHARQR